MKELSFYYYLRIRFSSPVSRHHFTVRCVPLSNERQQIRNLEISVLPEESLSHYIDSFGNYCVYGHCDRPQDFFEVKVKGTAFTGLSDFEYAESEYMLGRYRYQTDCTRPGKMLEDFHRRFVFGGQMSNLEKSMRIMEELYQTFRYEKGVTNPATTAEEAFTAGCGVCQDYAHIFLSLCRMEKIPARYVVGMLTGEGESHAWVEIFDDQKWYALDPTNMLIVQDNHIKISSGRDSRDCRINHGIMVGNAVQTQKVEVLVEEKQ